MKICPRCGGNLLMEIGEFDEEIRKCILCGRSPDQTQISIEELMLMTKGTFKKRRVTNANKRGASEEI